ncbi:PAS domain S-box-containing protein [Janthinobacterium sp. CG_23.3]|uniref:PAS domain-containing protein n=1 Tax=Janthinobacterium sp. CG_23.3 TaxID=3349634 RepID=UPI0038D378DF
MHLENIFQMISIKSFRSDQFHSAFMDSAIGMALVGLTGRWMDVNDALCEIVGYGKPELLTLRFQDITHPEDLDSDLTLVAELLKGNISSYNLEKRYIRKDGTVVWTLLTVSVGRNSNLAPDFFISQIIDISKQKRAESDRDAYFDLSPDLLAIADSKGFLVHVSPAWTDLLGWTKSELTSKPSLDFVHPEDHSRTVAEAASLYAGNATVGFRNRYIHRDGGIHWIEWNARIVTSDRFYCAARDVTAQEEEGQNRRAELAALDAVAGSLLVNLNGDATDLANQLYVASQLFESSPDCVKIVDLNGNLLAMNRNGQCLMEIDDCADLIGKQWASLWPAQIQGEVHSALDVARSGKNGRFEAFCPTAKGAQKWWDVMVTPIFDLDGKVEKILSVSRDVTLSTQAKNEIKNYATRLEQITVSVPVALFQMYCRTDGEIGIHYISQKFEQLFSIHCDDVLLNWTQMGVHADDKNEFAQVIRESAQHNTAWAYECRLLPPDGSNRWVRFDASPTASSISEVIYTGVIQDVTEDRAGNELKRSQAEKIRLLIQNANDAFVGMDHLGVITEWNAQAEHTLGWSATEAIGTKMAELIIPPALRSQHSRGMHSFLHGGTGKIINKRVEVLALHKLGRDYSA